VTKFIASDKLKYHPRNVAEFLDTGFSSPISVQFQITNRCRFRCVYCDKVLNDEESTVTDKFISRLTELGVKSIVLTGGEPVIYRKFAEDVPRLAEAFKLGLVTTLCEYQPLLETHFEWVKVSMDSISDETYRKIKRGPGIAKVLENLEKIYRNKRSDMPLGTQIVLTHENKDSGEIEAFIERVYDHCDYIQIRPIESIELYEYGYDDYRMLEEIGARYHKVTISDKFHLNQTPTNCHARWSQMLIDVNHDVQLCCNRVEERIGNIYDEDIIEKNRQYRIDFRKCYRSCVLSCSNHYLEGVINGKHKDFV
jgi:MoaA/NifB/PqqE/SkfB family radical SAM enzyme